MIQRDPRRHPARGSLLAADRRLLFTLRPSLAPQTLSFIPGGTP
jgi:hypothetical protein